MQQIIWMEHDGHRWTAATWPGLESAIYVSLKGPAPWLRDFAGAGNKLETYRAYQTKLNQKWMDSAWIPSQLPLGRKRAVKVFFCCMSFGTTLWQKGHQQKWPTWHFGSSGWLHPATIPTQGLPFGPLQLSNINTSRSTTLMHSWRVTGVKTPVMRSRQSPDISVIQ